MPGEGVLRGMRCGEEKWGVQWWGVVEGVGSAEGGEVIMGSGEEE